MPMRSIEEQTDRVRALESAALQKRAARKKALTRYGGLAAALLLVVGGVAAIAPRIAGIWNMSEAPESNEPGAMPSEGFYDLDVSDEPKKEDCPKTSETTSEMAEKPDEAPTDKWSTTDEALPEAVFGEVLEVQKDRMLLRMIGQKEKALFGEQAWLVIGDVPYYDVGQVVTFTIFSIDLRETPPLILADSVYLE